ncbi:MAG: ABC transporter substrate-binding protein [Ruminococcaceae bacterium]|nr:ABC transporter substrate-binding protein [Oscillospiraceae bacterium]
MKKIISLVLMATLVLSSICIFTGCQKEDGITKVKLCEVTHSIFYAPQYVAISEGFFEEEGLEVELSNGQGADKVMAAVLSGEVDIGFAGPEAAIYVYNEGKDDYPRVFSQLTKRDGSFLVGKDKDDDFKWEHLKGKTIIPGRKGGVPRMTFEYAMRLNNLDPTKDAVLDDSIQFSLMAGAFSGGNADYVALFEPTASMIEKENKGYILASIGQATGEIPYTAYFAKQSYINENKETVQKFVNAIYKGQKWIMSHTTEEIADVLLPHFADTEKDILMTVIDRYKDIDVWNQDPVLTEDSFNRLQNVMNEAGELDKKASYSDLIDNSFANKAIENIK